MDTRKLTAANWCKEIDYSIMDPDGWRYPDGALDFFATKISRAEFDAKFNLCTVKAGFEQVHEAALRCHIISFSFEDVAYMTNASAYNVGMIRLPDGRVLQAGPWKETEPPTPAHLEVVNVDNDVAQEIPLACVS